MVIYAVFSLPHAPSNYFPVSFLFSTQHPVHFSIDRYPPPPSSPSSDNFPSLRISTQHPASSQTNIQQTCSERLATTQPELRNRIENRSFVKFVSSSISLTRMQRKRIESNRIGREGPCHWPWKLGLAGCVDGCHGRTGRHVSFLFLSFNLSFFTPCKQTN